MSLAYPHPYFWDQDTVTIPSTAGNVAYNMTVPVGYIYVVLSAVTSLVCDGTVADRWIRYGVTDGTNILDWIGYNQNAITAGQTRSAAIGQARYPDQAWAYLYDTNSHGYTGIEPILLKGGFQLRVDILGGVAGDAFTGFINILKIRV